MPARLREAAGNDTFFSWPSLAWPRLLGQLSPCSVQLAAGDAFWMRSCPTSPTGWAGGAAGPAPGLAAVAAGHAGRSGGVAAAGQCLGAVGAPGSISCRSRGHAAGLESGKCRERDAALLCCPGNGVFQDAPVSGGILPSEPAAGCSLLGSPGSPAASWCC